MKAAGTSERDDRAMSEHPPKPVFSLAVGVTGHRPMRLPPNPKTYNKVVREIARVLHEIYREARVVQDRYKDYFVEDDRSLVLISALAEGADTIAAQAALKSGFILDAALPFPQAVYEDDFDKETCKVFLELCSAARARLELPGRRGEGHEDEAYQAVGLTIVGLSDILLGVWDGGPSAGKGGTTEILTAAAPLGIPIIHIDANGVNPTRILWNGLSEHPVPADRLDDHLPSAPFDEVLPRLVEELVRPPVEDAEAREARRYFHERERFWNLRPEFPLLTALLFVRGLRLTDVRPRTLNQSMHEYVAPIKPPLGHFEEPAQLNLAVAYAWADSVGIHFAQMFRSAFVTNFLLAAAAVVAALGSLLTNRLWPIATEVALIVIVIANTLIGHRLRWHRRWVESREVAERLRGAVFFWMLGVQPRAFNGTDPTWTGWYVRAIFRAQGLRAGSLDAASVDVARSAIMTVLTAQCRYHGTTAERMQSLERRLEWFGLVMFAATILVSLDHLFLHEAVLTSLLPNSWLISQIAIALSAMLPALATASYGIRVIGDFEGIAKRSERAHETLKDQIKALAHDPPEIGLLRKRAQIAADAMLGDVSSWRLSAESRGLAIPG